MPVRRAGLALLALLLPLAAAHAEEVQVTLVAQGALSAAASAASPIDGAHFCSAAADPWAAPDVPDERGPPYPFYRLVFGQAGPGARLARPGPSIGLTLSDYDPEFRDHADPVNDSIEVTLDGRHFVGHADMRAPGFRLAVTFRPDGRGGAFAAHGLRETDAGRATIDLAGTWTCPPVAAELPDITVTVHRLFPGAVAAHPDPIPLRVSRSAIPCLDHGCAHWRVTDDAEGTAYLARVDLSRLHLARRLRREAERGEIDLLVGARVVASTPPRVVALELQGIAPAPPPAPGEPSAPIPEAALY